MREDPDERLNEAHRRLSRETAEQAIAALQKLSDAKRALAAMTPEEQADYLHEMGIASGNRYAGNPELLLKEQPHRDFRNPPKK